jgi:hypothetical protein
MPADEKGGVINVGKANDAIPEAIAAEITRLLQDGQSGRPVSATALFFPGTSR